ncbi:MAG: YggS family pyridoxal phosphate-dependent enzyme [Alphaproteobacteria bacterium]|nr:YggS family pyridoxal phosphate-dependent enzyme [Alphaproteobacteria bacterium]
MTETAASPPGLDDVAVRLDAVKARIAAAAREAGRDPAAVTLVAVSKTHPAAAVRAALAAGHRVFGENRVQEAEAKFPALRDAFPGLVLHLIGPLQTNKARDAVALFDVIETVDRPKLAAALAREMDRLGRRPDVLVQVNTGEEPQKAGVLPADADAFIEACRGEYGLKLRGLMCIPPADEEPELHFALLAEMAKRHGLPWLSMGMSADFEAAVKMGATHVRVGTAVFGHRPAG